MCRFSGFDNTALGRSEQDLAGNYQVLPLKMILDPLLSPLEQLRCILASSFFKLACVRKISPIDIDGHRYGHIDDTYNLDLVAIRQGEMPQHFGRRIALLRSI